MPKCRELKRGRKAQWWFFSKKKGLCVTIRRRKPHARFARNIKKHSVAVEQKRIAIYEFTWHRKAYFKERFRKKRSLD